jgi:myo-inositol 2-dehydrogenase/D-chiro-inositol 1-dehydrogenase
MRIVRVGLIGLGEVSQLMHLPILADHRHLFEVAGVFDVSPSLTAHCARALFDRARL